MSKPLKKVPFYTLDEMGNLIDHDISMRDFAKYMTMKYGTKAIHWPTYEPEIHSIIDQDQINYIDLNITKQVNRIRKFFNFERLQKELLL